MKTVEITITVLISRVKYSWTKVIIAVEERRISYTNPTMHCSLDS